MLPGDVEKSEEATTDLLVPDCSGRGRCIRPVRALCTWLVDVYGGRGPHVTDGL